MSAVQSKFLKQQNVLDATSNVNLLSSYIYHQQKFIKVRIAHSKQEIKTLYYQCSILNENLTQMLSLQQNELFNEKCNKWLEKNDITSIILQYNALQSDIEGNLKNYEYSIKLNSLIQNIIANFIVIQELTANSTNIKNLHN